jgi:hypothetical protein
LFNASILAFGLVFAAAIQTPSREVAVLGAALCTAGCRAPPLCAARALRSKGVVVVDVVVVLVVDVGAGVLLLLAIILRLSSTVVKF